MKVVNVRRMMWYVHKRWPVIFDGQPPSVVVYYKSKVRDKESIYIWVSV